jgi:hypothetical protein
MQLGLHVASLFKTKWKGHFKVSKKSEKSLDVSDDVLYQCVKSQLEHIVFWHTKMTKSNKFWRF